MLLDARMIGGLTSANSCAYGARKLLEIFIISFKSAYNTVCIYLQSRGTVNYENGEGGVGKT